MSTLENFVSPVLTRALGWTLLHSLWQGALVAAVLAGALLLLRRQRAEVRYAASAGALGLVVALAGITFGLYLNAGASKEVRLPAGSFNTVKTEESVEKALVPVSAGSAGSRSPAAVSVGSRPETAVLPASSSSVSQTGHEMPTVQLAASPWLAKGLQYFDNHLPLLVVAWLLGLLAMSLRMLGGLLYVQRLRHRRVRPLGAAWQERLAAMAARGGVRRSVALLESALVRVPLVVGHVRPVILLPLGTVAGLAPAHLEAILAHELAHVLRRDYLVNLLQTVAEVLFFYHPAVWFVAHCVRTERENCCDDTATALCGGDPLRLACALTALAEWNQSAVVATAPRLALAAFGGRGALLNRVRRLVQRRPAPPTLAEGLLAGALVLGGLGLLGSSVTLAGPLTQPAPPASKPAAFDWQTGLGQSEAKPAEAGDTTKRATTLSATATTATDDVLDGRPGRRNRDRRARRQGISNGRDLTWSGFRGDPGTVVITKDKKGRVTDLVVNGQRVDTGTGKNKINGKSKKGRDNGGLVETIRTVPLGEPEGPSYVFRSDGEAGSGLTADSPAAFSSGPCRRTPDPTAALTGSAAVGLRPAFLRPTP
jgi:beta-lactamase regulating signal transducer with metallopeptidase domain